MKTLLSHAEFSSPVDDDDNERGELSTTHTHTQYNHPLVFRFFS